MPALTTPLSPPPSAAPVKSLIEGRASLGAAAPLTQFVIVEGDAAANNADYRSVYVASMVPADKKAFCSYRSPDEHSYAYRGDHPTLNMFWAAEVAIRICSFLTQARRRERSRRVTRAQRGASLRQPLHHTPACLC